MSIIRSISVGEGDMFYIEHNSDNFSIIDCCMCEEDKSRIVKQLKAISKDKGITRFISTHPDDDHILGLGYLHQEMNLLNFYCVENGATKDDETEDFNEYCALRDDKKKAFYLFRGCKRKWMNLDSDEQDAEKRSNSGINILWPIVDNKYFREELKRASEGYSPNNISPVIEYSLKDGAVVLWMGDLLEGFMETIEASVDMNPADILFAAHHGRDKVPQKWLEQMNPKMVILGEAPSRDLDYYAGYNKITQNSAGDITLECLLGRTHVYVSNRRYSVNFLKNEGISDTYGSYIGTLLK